MAFQETFEFDTFNMMKTTHDPFKVLAEIIQQIIFFHSTLKAKPGPLHFLE